MMGPILVWGYGVAGRLHVKALRALGVDHFVCEPWLDRRLKPQIKGQKAWLIDLDEALAEHPSAVIIAVPPHVRGPHLSRLIASGVPILCEKPLAHTRASLEALPVPEGVFRVVANMRFHPGVRWLREHVERPLFARAHWGRDIEQSRGKDWAKSYVGELGVTLDAIHEIDYLTWLLGDVFDGESQRATSPRRDMTAENLSMLTLFHGPSRERGFFSQICLDYLRPWKSRGCEVVCEDRVVAWHGDGLMASEVCRMTVHDANGFAWGEAVRPDYDAMWNTMIDGWLLEIAGCGNEPVLPSFDEAVASVRVALEATGRW